MQGVLNHFLIEVENLKSDVFDAERVAHLSIKSSSLCRLERGTLVAARLSSEEWVESQR